MSRRATRAGSLDRLPDDIVVGIIADTGDQAVYAVLARTSHRMHRLCRTPCSLQTLSWGQIADRELPQRVRELAHDLQRYPVLRRHAQRITRQAATGVYDLVAWSPHLSADVKAEVQQLLFDLNRDVFRDVLAAPPTRRRRPDLTALIAAAPNLGPPRDPVGVPDWMRERIASFVQDPLFADPLGFDPDLIAKVRGRYRPPFDRVFPHAVTVAEYLIRRWPSSVTELKVLLALQSCGIRFPFADFMNCVDFEPRHVADIVPLLDGGDPSALPEKSVCLRSPRYLFALLTTPRFRYKLRACPGQFVALLFHMIDHGLYGHVPRLLDVPFVSEVVNATDDQGRTPLYYAVVQEAFPIVRLLLEVPNVNLYQETVHGASVFDEIEARAQDDLLGTCGFATVILSDVDNFMSYLRHLIGRGAIRVVRYLIADPFFQYVPRHCKVWLLQYTPVAVYDVLGAATVRDDDHDPERVDHSPDLSPSDEDDE